MSFWVDGPAMCVTPIAYHLTSIAAGPVSLLPAEPLDLVTHSLVESSIPTNLNNSNFWPYTSQDVCTLHCWRVSFASAQIASASEYFRATKAMTGFRSTSIVNTESESLSSIMACPYLQLHALFRCTTVINRARRLIRRTLSAKRWEGVRFWILKTKFRMRLITTLAPIFRSISAKFSGRLTGVLDSRSRQASRRSHE